MRGMACMRVRSDSWMLRCMDLCMDAYIYELIDRSMHAHMDGFMDACMGPSIIGNIGGLFQLVNQSAND